MMYKSINVVVNGLILVLCIYFRLDRIKPGTEIGHGG